MKNYVVYSLIDGEIIRSGVCSEIDFLLQKQNNEEVLEGLADSTNAYVAKGKIVFYTKEQKQEKQNKPFYDCQWSNETFKWIDKRSSQQKYNEYDLSAKMYRNELLNECDWTQLSDVNLPNKQSWIIYRQALRDITKQSGYPENIIWPTKPE